MTAAGSKLHWSITRWLLRRIISGATRRVLLTHTLYDDVGQPLRWLRPEIDTFLSSLETEAELLRPYARLDELKSFGNRLMAELAVFTASSNRLMRHHGIAPQSARTAVAEVGWDVYRRLLSLSSFPVRLITRNAGRRIRWTIRVLLHFPFDAKGAPGYAVESWIEDGDIHTHFTHCPSQTFVRRVAEGERDPEVLDAFYESWCLYDWHGADLIAGDGIRGHYTRSQTLSRGEPVCDMCWVAILNGKTTASSHNVRDSEKWGGRIRDS